MFLEILRFKVLLMLIGIFIQKNPNLHGSVQGNLGLILRTDGCWWRVITILCLIMLCKIWGLLPEMILPGCLNVWFLIFVHNSSFLLLVPDSRFSDECHALVTNVIFEIMMILERCLVKLSSLVYKLMIYSHTIMSLRRGSILLILDKKKCIVVPRLLGLILVHQL